MTTHAGSIFDPNRTQAVRLPAETRFPPGVRKVTVRVRGVEHPGAGRSGLGQLFPVG
ncbi:MAG: hypothetical protein LC097_09125 [Burkholderiales bacterium]|nr:hypothetical protein [Burkholderiales bacterium]